MPLAVLLDRLLDLALDLVDITLYWVIFIGHAVISRLCSTEFFITIFLTCYVAFRAVVRFCRKALRWIQAGFLFFETHLHME